MHSKVAASLGLIVLASASGAYAQYVPVTAKMRQTMQAIENGKIVSTRTEEGTFYRTKDGSWLERWNRGLRFSTLWDNKTQTAYQVNYNTRVAIESPEPPDFGVPDFLRKEAPGPPAQSSVEGIPCTLKPVRLISSTRTHSGVVEDAGQVCWSTEYKLRLKQETRLPSGSDGASRQIFELYDIKLNAGPDPKLFDLQGSFTVARSRGGKN